MSFFRRIPPVTLEDELADLADRQPRPERDNWSRFRKVEPVVADPVLPVTLDDRRAQIREAMKGASDTEAMHLAVLALRHLPPAALHHLVREMDRQIWKAMKP